MSRNIYLIVILLVYFVFSGCKTREKLVYLQDSNQIKASTNISYDPILKIDDFVSVTVLGVDPEAARPFNIPTINSAIVGGYAQGAPSPPGYVVDPEGNIDFPVIGKLKIAGLKRSEVTHVLKTKLQAYVQNPTILIKILNFKITVIGEVKTPGTFTIPNEKVTIFEGLAIAGDLLITGKRKNVKVIRDNNGERKEFMIDLTSSNIFNSPVYFLQQNDLIYVEPNRSKLNASVINSSNAGIILSSISVLLTMVLLFNK